MTPEELDRTIEFLVRQQAQFSVDLQRDHEVLNRGITELQTSMKKLAGMQIEMALNHRRIGDLIEIQAQRMDQQDQRMDQQAQRMDQQAQRMDQQAQRLDQNEKWQQQFQLEARERHEEALKRLDRILDKLAGGNPKPN